MDLNGNVWNAPIVPVFRPWPARKNALPTLKQPHDCSGRPLLTGGQLLLSEAVNGPWQLPVANPAEAVAAMTFARPGYGKPCAPAFLQGLW